MNWYLRYLSFLLPLAGCHHDSTTRHFQRDALRLLRTVRISPCCLSTSL